MKWETIWLMLGQAVLYLVIIRQAGGVKKIIPFLAYETAESIEQKMYGFDENINGLIATNEDGIITNVNKEIEVLFGHSKKDLIGANLTIIIPERFRAAHLDGMRKRKGKELPKRSYPLQGLKRDGSEFPIELVLFKKNLDKNPFYLGVIRDRTKEVTITRKYEQINEICKLKVNIISKGEEISNSGSWFWDVATGEIINSEGYRRITGIEQPKTTVDHVKERVLEKDKELIDAAVNKAFQGERVEYQFRMIRQTDMKIVKINSIIQPFVDEDGVVIALHGATRLMDIYNIEDFSKTDL